MRVSSTTIALLIATAVSVPRLSAAGEENMSVLRTQAQDAFARVVHVLVESKPETFWKLYLPTGSFPCNFSVWYRSDKPTIDIKRHWTKINGVDVVAADGAAQLVLRGDGDVTFGFASEPDASAAKAAAEALMAVCTKAKRAREFLEANLANDLTGFRVSYGAGMRGELLNIGSAPWTSECGLVLSAPVKTDRQAIVDLDKAVEVRTFPKGGEGDTSFFVAGPFPVFEGGEHHDGNGVELDPRSFEMRSRQMKALRFVKDHCNPTEPGGF